MAKNRKSQKHMTLTIPSSVVEANVDLSRIGKLDRLSTIVETEFTEAVANLRAQADAKLSPLLTERDALALSLQMFADMNRTTLLIGEEKTVKLSAGNFGWRWTPCKVTLGPGGEAKALLTISQLKLRGYVRVKKFLDKEALLKKRPDIPGIKFTQREEFFIDPAPAVDDAEASSNVIALKVG